MLIVSRKIQEAIHIGDSIVVRITAINGQRVRVGIEAPASTRVLRGELLDNSSAAAAPTESKTPRLAPRQPLALRRLGDVGAATAERHPLRWSMAAMRERLSRTVETPESTTGSRHGRATVERQESPRAATHRGPSNARG